MKKMFLLIFMFLAAFISACGSNNSSSQNIQVAFHDVPYPTEKYLRIGYTIKTWEYEKDNLELQKIIVLDNDTKAELLVIEKKDLPKIYKDPLEASPYFVWDTLTNYYLSIQLPIPLAQTPPKTVSHRFIFKGTTNSSEVTVEGAAFSPRTKETPVVIASPLKRKNLVYMNQSTMGYHFYTLFPMNGGLFRPERYAFDSMQLNNDFTAIFEGDPKVNTSYFNYGITLYAVADGVVVHVQDGLPENSGDAQDVKFKSTLELAGNFVVLDIGGGRYAYYCHCIPGSFLVRVGDRVKEGDPVALLGNSGNSTAPHVHFQITDGPEFFSSNGIPFVLKEYTKTGEVDESESSPVILPPSRVTNSMMENFTVFSVE
ncbi:MAG: M23 family metallopeptidase [Syntrophales bacterium]